MKTKLSSLSEGNRIIEQMQSRIDALEAQVELLTFEPVLEKLQAQVKALEAELESRKDLGELLDRMGYHKGVIK